MRTLFVALVLAFTLTAAAADNIPNREAVEIAFDRHKGKLYAAYARALRQQPGLKGRVDLEFTLEKDGTASRCRTVRSELGAPALEAELCKIVQAMTFPPREAPATTVKRIDFFPAG